MKVLGYKKVDGDPVKHVYITRDWVFIVTHHSVWIDVNAPDVHHVELKKVRGRTSNYHVVFYRVDNVFESRRNRSGLYSVTSGTIYNAVKYNRKDEATNTMLMEVLL